MKLAHALMMILVASTGCGGSQDASGSTGAHSTPVSDDLDVPAGMDQDTVGTEGTADAEGVEGVEGTAPADSTAAAPAVTFKLINNADEDLVFSLDKGWQPVIFAFSGEPPNAKPILMFPTFCTASCDAAEAEICPVCRQPEKVKDIKAAEKREVVAANAALEVPWDGQVHVYEETRGTQDGKPADCECYRTEPVPEGTYTVRACGLRLTQSAKASTKYQCVESSMAFPAEGPQVVELEFPAPGGK